MDDTLQAKLEALTAELTAVQEELRELAARRVDVQENEDSSSDDLARLDEQMAALRRRRTELQDRQLEIQRALIGNSADVQEESSGRSGDAGETSVERASGGWVKGLSTFLFVMGIVVILGSVLLWGVTRLLAPPSVEGVDESGGGAVQIEREAPASLEQRLIGLYLALNRDEIRQPASSDDSSVVFVVEPGETAVTIAQRLQAEGLITDAALFRRLLVYRGADQSLAAGTYQLRPNMTMDEIIVALQSGRQDEIAVTIPEGWRAEQIAERLEEQGILSAEEYVALVSQAERFRDEFVFLQELPAGATLEGFLFPDTYRVIAEEVTPEDFIRMQLRTFEQRVSPELRATMAEENMTLYEAIILASIVEREAVVEEERPLIAGVFENRWRDGVLLNADPTVQYALGHQPNEETWWKRPLLLEDLEVDSPYNTYEHPGLPPGPICNPGLAAIRAAVTAPPTDYYYFVSRGDGTHVFAETLEEHQQNVERYRP